MSVARKLGCAFRLGIMQVLALEVRGVVRSFVFGNSESGDFRPSDLMVLREGLLDD